MNYKLVANGITDIPYTNGDYVCTAYDILETTTNQIVAEKVRGFNDEAKQLCRHLNMGGGLGINYHEPASDSIPDFKAYFAIFNEFLEINPGQKIHFELGRSLVGQCGNLMTKVLYVKKGIHTNFVILDAGMTELIRPMLYQAHHEIKNINSNKTDRVKYDVVGPICESTDCFAKALELPETERGDLFRIYSAGAYGEVMASNYNLKTLHPAIFSE